MSLELASEMALTTTNGEDEEDYSAQIWRSVAWVLAITVKFPICGWPESSVHLNKFFFSKAMPTFKATPTNESIVHSAL